MIPRNALERTKSNSNKIILSKDSNIYSQLPKEPLFVISDDEYKKAITEIQSKLIETYKDLVEEKDWKFVNVNDKGNSLSSSELKSMFEKLFEFLFPLRYHMNKDRYEKTKLSKKTEDLMIKGAINKYYNTKFNTSNLKILSINEFLIKIFNNFDKYSDKNSSKTPSFTLFSGHDSNVTDFISNFLDINNLKKELIDAVNYLSEHDELIIRMNNRNIDVFPDSKVVDKNSKSYKINSLLNFVIPPFASSLILELHDYSDESKPKASNFRIQGKVQVIFKQENETLSDIDDKSDNLFIKIVYNNLEITQQLLDNKNYVEGKGISYKSFKYSLKKRMFSTNINNWDCKKHEEK